jgi:hypothetical protein
LSGLHLYADVLVASAADLREWAGLPGNVLERAVAEGQVVFDTR